ncbi:hypothetical protein Pa4123_92140 [Phytohabitans aurantiacus]|uniref:Transposase n=1 Tax=Phytohabitans aurantiacus TaxID=3016789 RepID=A0ABQ5RCH6_9ACTN|nr:hypothetical protein Pa4123_92140 [Phytohabitans aurantiacus]
MIKDGERMGYKPRAVLPDLPAFRIHRHLRGDPRKQMVDDVRPPLAIHAFTYNSLYKWVNDEALIRRKFHQRVPRKGTKGTF